VTEGAGDQKSIDGRCDMIRKEIERTDSEYDVEKLQERLAKLAGGVAQLKVGAATETEMKERKALYEDALHATRAAIAEGIVAGGGVALLQARKVLDKLNLDNHDEALGVRCLANVLDMPCRLIAENAGVDGSVVVNNIRRNKEKNYGYNALSAEYGDMRKAGVVDPVKVTRSALQNGASVACLLLTTESLVADIPSKEKADDHHHDHHGGDMGGMGGMGGMGMGGMGGMGGMM
jgi:chaperonin GroEL